MFNTFMTIFTPVFLIFILGMCVGIVVEEYKNSTEQQENGLYRESEDDLAYFVNDWFIHNFFKERFPEFVDKDGEFNGVEFQVSKEMLSRLLKLMCDKFNQERLDLSVKPREHRINPDNIDELKQTIQFMNDNPTAMVYYEGGY